MIALTRSIIRNPWVYIAGIIIATIFFGSQLRHMRMEPDVTDALPQKIPAKRLYDKMGDIFPTREFLFVGISGDDLYTPDAIADIWDLTRQIEAMPEVYSVLSPTNMSIITGTEDGMEVRDILNAPPTTRVEIDNFRTSLHESDLALGNLVARDGAMFGIMVLLKNTADPEDFTDIFVPFIAEADEKTDLTLILAGKPIVSHYLGIGMQRDMSTFFMGGLGLIFFLLLAIFRTLRGIFLPLGVVILSVIWTLGLMAFLGFPLSHATTVMPILIMSIAVADSIHIIARYYARGSVINEPRALVLTTMEKMNSPVIMTSLTTMAGFAALSTSKAEAIMTMGLFTAAGVFFALVISIVLIPAVLTLLPVPKRVQEGRGLLASSTNLFGWWGNLLGNHKRALYPIVIIVLLFSIVGFSRLEHSFSSTENFPEDHPVYQASAMINKHFAGTVSFQVMIEGQEPGQIKNPSLLQDMDDLKTFALGIDHVGDAVALSDFIKRINKVLNQDDETYYVIPAETTYVTYTDIIEGPDGYEEVDVEVAVSGRELIAQYLTLYEMSGKPEDLANMVDYNYQNAKMTILMDTDDMKSLREIDDQLNAFIDEHFEGTETAVTGMAKLILVVDQIIVEGQILSIILSLFLVWLFTSFMFKSPIIGLFNTLPLFFALLLNFIIMGLAGIHVNLETMITSSIAIGVGVDYAIHFVYAFRNELDSQDSYHDAVVATMKESGVAIAFNSFVVAAGFSIIALSEFVAIRHMGILISITMLTAAFGALTIVPLVFLNFEPKSLRRAPNN